MALPVAPDPARDALATSGSHHGRSFQPNVDIVVTRPGPSDYLDDGFWMDHVLGVFRACGTPAASSTIDEQAGDRPLDHFRHVPIPALPLNAEEDDVVGHCMMSGPGTDPTITIPSCVSRLTMDPAIACILAAHERGGLGLDVPDDTISEHGTGPNLPFKPGIVPKSMNLALTSVAVTGLILVGLAVAVLVLTGLGDYIRVRRSS